MISSLWRVIFRPLFFIPSMIRRFISCDSISYFGMIPNYSDPELLCQARRRLEQEGFFII
jgi:hypothetical protein